MVSWDEVYWTCLFLYNILLGWHTLKKEKNMSSKKSISYFLQGNKLEKRKKEKSQDTFCFFRSVFALNCFMQFYQGKEGA